MQSGEQQPGTVGGLPVAFEEVLAVVPKQGGGLLNCSLELNAGSQQRWRTELACSSSPLEHWRLGGGPQVQQRDSVEAQGGGDRRASAAFAIRHSKNWRVLWVSNSSTGLCKADHCYGGSNELEKHQLFRGGERASVAFEGLADAVLCICQHSISISTAAERRETSSTVLAQLRSIQQKSKPSFATWSLCGGGAVRASSSCACISRLSRGRGGGT